jgi:hypothetical protein
LLFYLLKSINIRSLPSHTSHFSDLAFPLVLVDSLGHEAGLGLEHILAVLPVPHKDPAINVNHVRKK